MKILIVLFLTLNIANAQPVFCDVKICNKIKRFSLDIWSHLKDSIGKTCWDMSVPKNLAIKGKELNSKTKWYQGSINPTKKSVTWVEAVYKCNK